MAFSKRFLKKKYQGFMNSDLTMLRNDLQVEAVDLDDPDTKNSLVRYEIIKGNYEKKFHIDEVTGVIRVKEPLRDDFGERRRSGRQSGKSLRLVVTYYSKIRLYRTLVKQNTAAYNEQKTKNNTEQGLF